MSSVSDDQAALLRVLIRHGVDFPVVGGVAAQLHGWNGATTDLDIAVSIADSNLDRLNQALVAVGAREPTVGPNGQSFPTIYGRLEVIRRADGIGTYEDWLREAGDALFDGLTIVVAAPADIVRSKEAAGREKDLAVLPEIRRAFNAAGLLDDR